MPLPVLAQPHGWTHLNRKTTNESLRPHTKNGSGQFLALTVASLVAAAVVFATGWLMAGHWRETLAGLPLPVVTVMATRYGGLGPLACSVASAVGYLCARRRGGDPAERWPAFTGIVVAELLVLCLVLWGYVWPVLHITYRLGQ